MATNADGAQGNQKVIVIGWDGADWRLLRPWLAAGKLPALARFIKEGSHGDLRSTIRPESSVAWASFSTGVNPGRHGIYGFAGRSAENSYAMPLTNAASIHVERFWDVLGRNNRQVGLLNVPYTYPPTPVNGFLVSGMLTPSAESAFTYPLTLKQELLDVFGSYATDVNGPNDNKQLLVENVRSFTEQQLSMALYLLRKKEWDFFTVVFVGPDRLQHSLWSDVDQSHPWHNPSSIFQNEILAHYQMLDNGLAQILQAVPEDTMILLVSDHGFNGCAQKFYVNHWLYQQGWLALKPTGGFWSASMSLMNHLHKIPLLRKLKQKAGINRIKLSDWRSASFTGMIDWSRTRAYFGLDGGIRINVRGREPEGIVSPGDAYTNVLHELRQQLAALCDPNRGHPLFSAIFANDEIYNGPHLDLAPDLILEPQRERSNAAENFMLDGAIHTNPIEIFGTSAPYSGNHALDGILCAWGPGIRPSHRVNNARIIDLAPTVLGAMGAEIPAQMDGSILDIFRDPIVIRSSDQSLDVQRELGQAYSDDEAELIKQRLRDLGYL